MSDPTPARQGALGTGSEATNGLDPADGNGERGANARGSDRPDAEQLDRDREHDGSYGGQGGKPRESSDTREPHDPR